MQGEACRQLLKSQRFHQTSHLDVHQDTGTVSVFQVSCVNEQMLCNDLEQNSIWLGYLRTKLWTADGDLKPNVETAVAQIFQSSKREEKSKEKLKFSDLLLKKPNPLLAFFNGVKGRPATDVQDDLRDYFLKEDKVSIQRLY